MPALLATYAFIIGAIVGSFLNVVIYRYPREESVVFPASHCPHCDAPIRWYDNIPLVSFAILLARCRNCRQPIDFRYPLVELANALFYLAIFLRTGVDVLFVLLAAVVSMTIALIYIDAEIQILPDVIDLPGVAAGLLIGTLGAGKWLPGLFIAHSWLDSLIGAAAGAGSLLLVIGAYWLVRRAEGMGQGDVKMMAMIGAVLGWRGVPAVLVLASVAGTIIGLPAALRSDRGMQMALPFGVFLGLAAMGMLFFGDALTAWYGSLLMR